MHLGHWKARLGYLLFGAGCRLIARGARLLPSIAGWSADMTFTDGMGHGTGEILHDDHWRGIRLPFVGPISQDEWLDESGQRLDEANPADSASILEDGAAFLSELKAGLDERGRG